MMLHTSFPNFSTQRVSFYNLFNSMEMAFPLLFLFLGLELPWSLMNTNTHIDIGLQMRESHVGLHVRGHKGHCFLNKTITKKEKTYGIIKKNHQERLDPNGPHLLGLSVHSWCNFALDIYILLFLVLWNPI